MGTIDLCRGRPMPLPHDFKRIRLDLARSKEFPNGSFRHGYEFVAPLDSTGHMDLKLWRQHRDHCRVRRFWDDEEEQVGLLVHKPGVQSMHAGCSTTTRRAPMTMNRAIGSPAMLLRRENMSRSARRTASCIRSRSLASRMRPKS